MTAKKAVGAKASPPAQEPAAVVKLLSAQDILDAPDYMFEDVDVPEWGGVVRIKGLSGDERDAFEASMVETRGKSRKINLKHLRAKLVALAAIDAEGHAIFKTWQIEELGKKSAAGLQRCFEVAQRLSRLSEEDVEELIEDFALAPSGLSISD